MPRDALVLPSQWLARPRSVATESQACNGMPNISLALIPLAAEMELDPDPLPR